MVEALTIVLALGITRGRRAPLQGAAAALAALVSHQRARRDAERTRSSA